jgi:hypothetical protein
MEYEDGSNYFTFDFSSLNCYLQNLKHFVVVSMAKYFVEGKTTNLNELLKFN